MERRRSEGGSGGWQRVSSSAQRRQRGADAVGRGRHRASAGGLHVVDGEAGACRAKQRSQDLININQIKSNIIWQGTREWPVSTG